MGLSQPTKLWSLEQLRFKPSFFFIWRIRLEVFNEVDAVNLALLINHIVAFKFVDLAEFFQSFKLRNTNFQLPVMHVLCVPIWYLVELKQVSEFHTFLMSICFFV